MSTATDVNTGFKPYVILMAVERTEEKLGFQLIYSINNQAAPDIKIHFFNFFKKLVTTENSNLVNSAHGSYSTELACQSSPQFFQLARNLYQTWIYTVNQVKQFSNCQSRQHLPHCVYYGTYIYENFLSEPKLSPRILNYL